MRELGISQGGVIRRILRAAVARSTATNDEEGHKPSIASRRIDAELAEAISALSSKIEETQVDELRPLIAAAEQLAAAARQDAAIIVDPGRTSFRFGCSDSPGPEVETGAIVGRPKDGLNLDDPSTKFGLDAQAAASADTHLLKRAIETGADRILEPVRWNWAEVESLLGDGFVKVARGRGGGSRVGEGGRGWERERGSKRERQSKRDTERARARERETEQEREQESERDR